LKLEGTHPRDPAEMTAERSLRHSNLSGKFRKAKEFPVMLPQPTYRPGYNETLCRIAQREEKRYMKRILLSILAVFCMGAVMELNAQNQSGGKILVAYFSWSGNARALAGQIARETGGDLFEIKTVKAYPEIYNECTAVAKQEQNDNARPVLSGSVANMAQYNTVFLCYPNWWGTLPMGVFTFLEAYDLSGKTIYPLVTHGGSRFGRSLDDIQKLCPRVVLGEGLSVSAFDTNPNDSARVTTPNREATSWLRRLGMANS
jgi:flavodoxin